MKNTFKKAYRKQTLIHKLRPRSTYHTVHIQDGGGGVDLSMCLFAANVQAGNLSLKALSNSCT
jgi:hypothetical protein